MNAARGPRSGFAREREIQSEVQRAIQRSIKGVEYFRPPAAARVDAERHPARPGTMNLYHYGARGRDLPRAGADRDGDHQPRLHPRHGARPELH